MIEGPLRGAQTRDFAPAQESERLGTWDLGFGAGGSGLGTRGSGLGGGGWVWGIWGWGWGFGGWAQNLVRQNASGSVAAPPSKDSAHPYSKWSAATSS